MTNKQTLDVVASAQEALSNIALLQDEVHRHPHLAMRLGQAHAFYMDARVPGEPVFGFSKFVGYSGIDGEVYLRNYKNLDGRNTEWALSDWFNELPADTPEYRTAFEALSTWLRQFHKTPRKGVRIMALDPSADPDARAPAEAEDTRLLDALIAASKVLPVHQRSRLKASL